MTNAKIVYITQNMLSIIKPSQYGLLSFQIGGTKFESFLPKNQHTRRKLLNFENWVF